MITACVLLYGDHLRLAQRCLSSLLPYIPQLHDVRLGLNACGNDTRQYVADFCEVVSRDIAVKVIDSPTNIYKYPMMRQLFALAPLQPYVSWFDDDSFIRKPGRWYDDVLTFMDGTDMLGSVYRMPLRGRQADWIEDQPWYTGRPVNTPRYSPTFCTGGYWTIRSEILTQHDWPTPQLCHRGGDVMLGELLRQQGKRITNARTGVAINADLEGRESKSPRRGYDERAIGVDYVRTVMKDS